MLKAYVYDIPCISGDNQTIITLPKIEVFVKPDDNIEPGDIVKATITLEKQE